MSSSEKPTSPHPGVGFEYLEYPMRRHGMDHDRYSWSMLADRKPVAWPGGKKLAVWVNVSVQHFPLNPQGKPVKLPGGMTMPYPDLRHYTLRDYGNRVGIFRVLDALNRHNLKATMAVNACLCERYPQLVEAIVSRGDEVIGHSWSMDTPHAGGLDEAAEAALIERSLATLRAHTKQPVTGWLSPGKLETPQTPELLKANGIEYFCDWVNDDMPYKFQTANGQLLAMPLSTELEDRLIIVENFQSESDWADQIIDACNFLRAEAEVSGGRILSIPIHPWVLGQPHRIKHLERALAHVMSTPDVWSATAGEIAASFTAAQR